MQQQIITIKCHKQKFKFQKQYFRIFSAAPALKHSLCFLGVRSFKQHCLVHVSSQNKILKQLIFEANIDQFAMLSSHQAAVLLPYEDSILIWNLQNHQEIKIPFYYLSKEPYRSNIHIFPETHLICIQQNGQTQSNKLKLTYFKYPLTNQSKPQHVYQNQQVWTSDYTIKKANNHSMLCWFKSRHDDGFQFKTYDLKKPQGQHKCYKFNNPYETPKKKKQQMSITTMWEMTPLKFLLVCISSRKLSKQEIINNNFVYNAENGQFRQSKFTFGKLQDQTLDQMNLGKISVFRTFQFDNGIPKQSPVYYINNDKESIIKFQHTWHCDYKHKVKYVGNPEVLYVELKYENANVSQMEMSVFQIQ